MLHLTDMDCCFLFVRLRIRNKVPSWGNEVKRAVCVSS